ncbi:hypothetical protein Btru_059476 [Bulinus truncatus]|nr:hypothetical protein Btru_059476 [Bulinus truncatus]
MAASKLSDEELLGDNLGGSIYIKSPENDLIGEDGEIDEDALLSVDDTGGKSVSVSFSNDNIHPLTSRHLSRVHGHGHQHKDVQQILLVDEQAFVFDKTDTADLEDELNIAGEEEGQYGIPLEHNEGLIYNDGTEGTFSDNLYHNENDSNVQQNLDFSSNRIIESAEERYVNVGQESYEDNTGLYDSINSVNYSGDGHEDSVVDSSSVELGYEQPTEHEEQVHLEYENSDSHNHEMTGTESLEEPTGTNEQYASESESDEESSRHSRGKFTSERTGVISLTATTTRESIPDTLEINDEQAAQIEQFLLDKSGRGHKAKNRMGVHSRLGVRPLVGPQALLPAPRLNLFPRGVFIQRPRLGGPFQNSLSVTFPGMMNQRGPLNRMINERIPFPGRFPGVSIQRGQFMRPEQKMHQSNISSNLRGLTTNLGGLTPPPYRLHGGDHSSQSHYKPHLPWGPTLARGLRLSPHASPPLACLAVTWVPPASTIGRTTPRTAIPCPGCTEIKARPAPGRQPVPGQWPDRPHARRQDQSVPGKAGAAGQGRMFFREKKALTRGEKEIIEGIYKNRGDASARDWPESRNRPSKTIKTPGKETNPATPRASLQADLRPPRGQACRPKSDPSSFPWDISTKKRIESLTAIRTTIYPTIIAQTRTNSQNCFNSLSGTINNDAMVGTANWVLQCDKKNRRIRQIYVIRWSNSESSVVQIYVPTAGTDQPDDETPLMAGNSLAKERPLSHRTLKERRKLNNKISKFRFKKKEHF